MTPEGKAYYSDGYYPLFKLMSEEFGLTLLEQDMAEIMNCVRKMDEARKKVPRICEYCAMEVMESGDYCSVCNNLLQD